MLTWLAFSARAEALAESLRRRRRAPTKAGASFGFSLRSFLKAAAEAFQRLQPHTIGQHSAAERRHEQAPAGEGSAEDRRMAEGRARGKGLKGRRMGVGD